jgi:hypothetical protein
MQKLIITGVAGVLIGAVAFSTKPSISQSQAPTPTPTTEPATPLRQAQGEKTRRLTISISVAAMADLKVSEGQTLQTGDTIADRALDRQRLEAQKAQLTLSLARLQTATIRPPQSPAAPAPIAALPNPSFLEAQAQVEKSKADVDSISATITNKKAEIDYLGTLPNLNPIVLDHERAKLAELEQQHTATVRDYQLAMGKLSTAQEGRDYQEYQHSLSQADRTEAQNRNGLEYQRQVADFEQRHRDRDFQISQTQLKLNEIDNQLATLSAVRAPQPGKIRRIKWLGQSADGRLNAELTFIPDRSGAGRPTALSNQPTPMPQPTQPSGDRPQSGVEDD